MSDNEEETVVLSNKQLTEALKSLTNKIDILINNSSNNNNNKEKHSSSETSIGKISKVNSNKVKLTSICILMN